MRASRSLLTIVVANLCFASGSYATSQFELSENIYSIYLANGGKYKVFDDFKAVGQCTLEWKSFQAELAYEYLITIRAKDASVRLYSNNGEILEIELFDGLNPSTPITLFDLQNFYVSAISVSVEKNATIMRYPIQIVIPPHQCVGPGIYKCFLDIGVYTDDAVEINNQTIQLTAEVDASQRILIKAEGLSTPQGGVTLDFGEVCTTTTKNVFLYVQSNVNYQLSAQSMNGSKLVLAPNWRRSYYQCSSILYDCSCDGLHFVLQNMPQKIQSGYFGREANEITHCFSITLYPDPKQNWEGIYEDEILFSLQPIY